MIYLEIKPGTKEHEKACRCFTYKLDWQNEEVLNEFQSAIGIDPINIMEMNPRVLRLEKLPDEAREQFKKNVIGGKYEAKATSEINKKYLAVVSKYNLTAYTVDEFSFMFGFGYIRCVFPIKTKDSLRVFLMLREDLSDTDLTKIKAHPSLAEIKEYEYLELRAAVLREEGANS